MASASGLTLTGWQPSEQQAGLSRRDGARRHSTKPGVSVWAVTASSRPSEWQQQ